MNMKNSESKFYICFDYGTKRIGVAVGQKLTKTATPLATLLVRDHKLPWSEIEALIEKWKPKAFLVGVPLNLDGSPDQMTGKARKFISQLRKRYKIEVIGIEERLTTKAAREQVFEEGGYKALGKAEIDSLAAKIMLESWLAN